MRKILVINAGSSSIKFVLFDEALNALISGQASEIGGASTLRIGEVTQVVPLADHVAALAACLQELDALGHPLSDLHAAAHRVVHGGRKLVAPCRITPAVEAEIEACVPLAPLHNPHNLSAIRAIARIAPGLPQFASFDTAFHATNPEEALRYALPAAEEAKGIRRYGFHGISYAGLVARLPGISGAALPRRLLALHLGNGASLCAIKDGRSVATTMGYSPLDGLTMGTRTGEIDGMAVLRLAAEHGVERASDILNRESGLRALGGTSDMRTLEAATHAEARFAVRHFCYWIVRHAGSMIAAMGGLDAVAFTGGIGEHDAHVRAEVAAGLGWLGVKLDAQANARGDIRLHAPNSLVAMWKVLAYEEQTIAQDALAK
ncbi:acetate kinase [mine drainage metagenome]|uniref:Acetate kinase n=1 Tax=mine drainage metagenome TaxID=410659 RepID=A0A1J5PPF2_9ZZZZ